MDRAAGEHGEVEGGDEPEESREEARAALVAAWNAVFVEERTH
jgi:hypothetical protein